MDKQSTSRSGKRKKEEAVPRLDIAATKRSPEIKLDPEAGVFSIKGTSMPENVNHFYRPVLNALDRYIQQPADKTQVIFSLEYINSSSSQLLLALLYKVRDLVDEGHHVTIEWHYMVDDEDIYDTGKSYSELSGLTFNFYEHQYQ
jgi:hypothetical protein